MNDFQAPDESGGIDYDGVIAYKDAMIESLLKERDSLNLLVLAYRREHEDRLRSNLDKPIDA